MNSLIDVLCNQDDSTGEEKEKSPKLHYLGPFVSNLSQLSGVREKLLGDSCKLMSRLLPFTEYLTSSGEKHLNISQNDKWKTTKGESKAILILKRSVMGLHIVLTIFS